MCKYCGELWEVGKDNPLFITEDDSFRNVYDVCLYGLKDCEHELNRLLAHYYVIIYVDGIRRYKIKHYSRSHQTSYIRYNSDGTEDEYMYSVKFETEYVIHSC